jgi:hypothetical protein
MEQKENRKAVQKRWNSKESSKELKRKYYKDNREKILLRNRKHNKNLKIEVLSHYSKDIPVCLVCGILDVDVLTIDHISGGGNKHKSSIGGSLGRKLYTFLKKSGFPPGYQVLCFNCNWKKHLRETKNDIN